MFKKATIVMIVCLFCVKANAAELTNEAQIKKLTQKAISLIANGNIDGAMETLKPYWPLQPTEIDELTLKVKNQKSIIDSRFGKSLGFEFVDKKRIGNVFVRYTYIEKFERHILRWIFTFYKPSNKWVVNGVKFEDRGALFVK
jgi:hypothetical protein